MLPRAEQLIRQRATPRGPVHLHPVLGTPSHCTAPCIPPMPIASVTGSTTPERGNMHSLNRPLLPGTRKASRGREGCARSARPHARERGHSAASDAPYLRKSSGSSNVASQNSPSCAWGGGTHQVLGSRPGQISVVIAWWSSPANCNRVPRGALLANGEKGGRGNVCAVGTRGLACWLVRRGAVLGRAVS